MEKEISAENRIAIIGSGHIGSALAGGLARSGIQAQDITAAGPSVLQNHKLKKFGVCVTRDNNNAALSARWIFLAVKPADVPAVLKEIRHNIKDKVVISLAAGVRIMALKKYASDARVARIMPNIPIAVGRGFIGYFSGSLTKKEKKELGQILSGLGTAIEVKSEREIDVITLLSGCGPGIIAFLMAMLADNARMLGLSTKTADALARQTFDGTLAYLARCNVSPKELLKSVATKGGVTEAILADFRKHGFTKNFTQAIGKGYARIKKLNK